MYDAEAADNIKKIYGDKITYHSSPYDAAKDCDGLCILTEWNEFKQADMKKVKSLLKTPVIIDGRNLYDLADMDALKYTYVSTGRMPVINSV